MFTRVHVLTKREIRKFHVVVVRQRQRNVQKSVIHVQSCFANLNLWLFCRRRSCSWNSQSDDDHYHNGDIETIRLIPKTLFLRVQFLCTFLCPHCTTSRWKCLISRIMEDVNKRRRNIFSKRAEIIVMKIERFLATVSRPSPSSDLKGPGNVFLNVGHGRQWWVLIQHRMIWVFFFYVTVSPSYKRWPKLTSCLNFVVSKALWSTSGEKPLPSFIHGYG